VADDSVRHGSHDLAALVAFVDGEADPAETAAATTRLAECGECARLVDDLRALTTADRTMAVPARPRDFRLTAADAARLGIAGEPTATPARLVIDMTERHPTHDPALIAASVDDVLTVDERRTVDTWLAACSACSELRADLVAIAAANKTLPTPARPRDYRLTEQDVARVGQARWKQLLAWIGGSRDGVTRPLAAGLMTLGLVGILISGAPSLSFGSSAGAAPAAAPTDAAAPAAAPSAASGTESTKNDTGTSPEGSIGPAGAAQAIPGPSGSLAPEATDPSYVTLETAPGDQLGVQEGDSSLELRVTDQGPGTAAGRDAATADVPMGLALSLAALVAGLLLFVARRAARSMRSF
jgi:anti-sigma factor RsiW